MEASVTARDFRYCTTDCSVYGLDMRIQNPPNLRGSREEQDAQLFT